MFLRKSIHKTKTLFVFKRHAMNSFRTQDCNGTGVELPVKSKIPLIKDQKPKPFYSIRHSMRLAHGVDISPVVWNENFSFQTRASKTSPGAYHPARKRAKNGYLPFNGQKTCFSAVLRYCIGWITDSQRRFK
ncbi:MAG: hypothetical protein DWH80_10620 [Planctomycetota bacterium]|nr:MAG: hypothetical protein DWH80_10620 [Planctomycetota bacterium]